MNYKYFLAVRKEGKIWNDATNQFDTSISVYEAVPAPYTLEQATEQLDKKRKEIRELGGDVDAIILRIAENIDTDGKPLGTYSLPRFSDIQQLVFDNYSF